MANIVDFVTNFDREPARPSRFDVQFGVPNGLYSYLNIGRNLAFRCERAELPGRTLSTFDRKIYGPVEKHPYLMTYNDLNFTFIVSDTMEEKAFFDAWLELINPQDTYNMKYKTDYVTDVIINQYTLQDENLLSITLLDAFPISVNQLDLDWSSDGYHKLSVTFAYYKWESNMLTEQGTGTTPQPVQLDTGGNLYDIPAISKIIDSLR
jgi:hypothetical protein